MIATNNLTFRVGKKALFEDVNIKFLEGQCYGVIGANGAGKSTLLKILSGQLEPTSGEVVITKGQRLSFLEQDQNKYDDYTVLDTVILGNPRLYQVMKEKDAIYAKPDFSDEDGIKAAELESEFAEMNGWDAESDAATLLEGLDAGVNAGAEAVMIQTFFDVEMMRVAATEAKKYGLPLFCTMSFEKTGKTMMGNSVQKIIDTLGPIGLSGIGMNCSLGPELALPVIREFAEKTDIPLVFKPNAGMPISNGPDGGASPYTPEMFVNEVRPALEFVSYIGGCCGCNPAYIEALKKAL